MNLSGHPELVPDCVKKVRLLRPSSSYGDLPGDPQAIHDLDVDTAVAESCCTLGGVGSLISR